jgi:signal peptidase II
MSPAGPPAADPLHGGNRTRGSLAARPVFNAGLVSLVAVVVIVIDQLTKSWVLHDLSTAGPRHVVGPIYLALTFNRGAAFSLGAGASPIIEAVAIALVVGVIAVSRRAARGGASIAVLVGLGLLLGGALSNLGDRLFRHHAGAVVDFIQLVSWWPTFNVADASITVGAVTIVIAMVFFPPARSTNERASETELDQPAGGPTRSSRHDRAVHPGSATRPGGAPTFGRWA